MAAGRIMLPLPDKGFLTGEAAEQAEWNSAVAPAVFRSASDDLVIILLSAGAHCASWLEDRSRTCGPASPRARCAAQAGWGGRC
jgi:hypothetical protein